MTSADFTEALLAILDRKDHVAWKRWVAAGVTPVQLLLHFQQEWLVFVRDFPRLLGRVHGACPHADVRRALAANIYEEETGALSHSKPHPELFLDQMAALGFDRDAFDSARLLPEAAAYRALLDAATSGPWLVGAAVVTIWVEGSVHERKALRGEEEPLEEKLASHFLVRHHGLRPDQLTLQRAHAAVEGGHRHDAWDMVTRHATTDESRAEILSTVEKACSLWHVYRDAVTRAAGL